MLEATLCRPSTNHRTLRGHLRHRPRRGRYLNLHIKRRRAPARRHQNRIQVDQAFNFPSGVDENEDVMDSFDMG
jgi:hypothetical protein